jgi:N6-L-threonylcarbamoyladenine synthase
MLLLALETSCDETAAAVVEDGRRICSNVVRTQVDLHARYGGVVPEIASRAHLETITLVIREAMAQAGVTLGEIDAVAVANTPGLVGCLLIGVTAAKTLAWSLGVPLIGLDHLSGHVYAAAMSTSEPVFPAVALVVSGGHTSLYACRSATERELLGSTLDDAAGEAFDKVAAILNLGYPGGPVVDRMAAGGDPTAFGFPRSMLEPGSLDFSFSGLKTAVLYRVRGQGRRGGRPLDVTDARVIANVCASFQAAVVDVLTAKTLAACERTGLATILLAGGVAANSALRAAFGRIGADGVHRVVMAERRLCTDNAAMMAAAYEKYLRGEFDGLDLPAVA